MPAFSSFDMITGLLTGGFGFVAFTYGKRMQCWVPMLCGLGLMLLPLILADLPLYLGSLALAAAAVLFRNS